MKSAERGSLGGWGPFGSQSGWFWSSLFRRDYRFDLFFFLFNSPECDLKEDNNTFIVLTQSHIMMCESYIGLRLKMLNFHSEDKNNLRSVHILSSKMMTRLDIIFCQTVKHDLIFCDLLWYFVKFSIFCYICTKTPVFW